MVRAATEIGLKTQLFGGAMVGMQYASLIAAARRQAQSRRELPFLRAEPEDELPRHRGVPEEVPGAGEGRRRRSARLLPAAVRLCGDAGAGAGRSRRPAALNDDKLAEHIHKNAFDTIVGEIRFNELGEWATARPIVVQFQNVQGSGLEQYMTGHKQVIVYPPEYKDGELEYAVREVSDTPCHADHRRRGAREIRRRSRSSELELTDPRPDEVLVQDRRERHVPDRPARARRLLRHAAARRCSATRAPASCEAVGRRVTTVRARRPRGDVVSLVRRLRQLPARAWQSHCQQQLRPEDARHARRRLDPDAPGRRAGLQRVLPAILVRDPRHRQRALRREGQERCAARAARAVRLQRPDRRRRGAQLDAAAARRCLRGVRRRRGRAVAA